MRDHLVIFVNGKRHEVRGEAVFRPLTDWLRYDLRLTGTKVVCAEGDCGSCTILLGRPVRGEVAYRGVCGCIQYLLQLDGMHVVTIEGLKYDGQPNPVQDAFVACHGAQCGFCTPGFVVSLHELLQDREIRTPAIKRGLTGNLCRCTGYEPILTAAESVDRGRMRSVGQLFPSGPTYADLDRLRSDPVLVRAGDRSFYKPTSISQAVQFRAGNPGCATIAGGTDLGVQMNKGLRRPAAVLSTAGLPDWDSVHVEADCVTVAGGASLMSLESAAAAVLPEFAQYLEWFGSPQIRHAGTLAGNLANASPIGDTLPPLFVLDAEICLTGVGGERWVKINDFYAGYRATVMQPDELISSIRIPVPARDEVFKLYKLSKRKDLDISTFSAAVWMRLRAGMIIDCRIAYGGVGPVVVRLHKTEAALRGRPFELASFQAIADQIESDISPIGDVRGSRDYRNLLARNILQRMQVELSGAGENGVRH